MPNCNPGLDAFLQHPVWKWSRSILKGKDKGEVNKKEKYRQEILHEAALRVPSALADILVLKVVKYI